MHTADTVRLAAELVKASLAAGWLSNSSTGESHGKQIAAALAEIHKKVNELANP